MNLEDRAKAFATDRHKNQKRKYTLDPYIVHPEAVANIVRSVPGATEAMICAAWCHDVVEDTGTTLEEVERETNAEVRELVEWLTDVSRPTDGNRAARKRLDLQHLAVAPAEAQTVKLADLLDNTRTIVAYDKDFAQVYLREKRDLLRVLVKGDPMLRIKARDMCELGLQSLSRAR